MTLFTYVLRQLLVSFGFALGGVAFLVLPSVAVQAVHKLGGVSLQAVAKYIPMSLIELVPFLLPMAFLLSVVATFGRMAADRELIAVHMARFHPWRLLLPGLAIATALSAATHFLIADLAPRTKYARRAYLAEMRDDVFELLGPGRSEHNSDDFSVRWSSFDEATRTMKEVLLWRTDEEGREITVQATSARISTEPETLVFELENAETVFGTTLTGNERPVIRIPIAGKDKLPRDKAKYQSSSEISSRLAEGGLTPEVEREFHYEIHARRALAVIYVLFVLIGVPTGIALKSGTQLAALCVAVGYALIYYLVAIRLGKELAAVGTVPAAVAAWATNGLFCLSGLIACRRVLGR